jgi:hypothetical protein
MMLDLVLRILVSVFCLGIGIALSPGAYDAPESDVSGVGAVIALWAFILTLVVVTWSVRV